VTQGIQSMNGDKDVIIIPVPKMEEYV